MDKLNDMHGKVILVTAGTGGIGKETATELAKLGARLIVPGRDAQRGRAAVDEIRAQGGNSNVEVLLADLSLQPEVARLASEFSARYDRLDVLINNVGGVRGKRIETADGIESTFATTYLNVFLLTSLLLPLLKASRPSRIVNVNSSVHRFAKLDFDDLQSRQRYQPPTAYSRAKLANVLFTYELSRRLSGTGVTANCADPGMADTPGTRASTRDMPPAARLIGLLAPLARLLTGTTSIEKAAWSSVYLAASSDVEGITGHYFSPRGMAVKSAQASYDLGAAQQLWKISEALVAPHLKAEPVVA